jgi:hypothetical protein
MTSQLHVVWAGGAAVATCGYGGREKSVYRAVQTTKEFNLAIAYSK